MLILGSIGIFKSLAVENGVPLDFNFSSLFELVKRANEISDALQTEDLLSISPELNGLIYVALCIGLVVYIVLTVISIASLVLISIAKHKMKNASNKHEMTAPGVLAIIGGVLNGVLTIVSGILLLTLKDEDIAKLQ